MDAEVGEEISGNASVTKSLFFTIGSRKRFADGISYGGSSGSVSLPFGTFNVTTEDYKDTIKSFK